MESKIGNFKAGVLKDYRHFIELLFNKDQGFYFMNQIRGTPAYWKKRQSQVLTMIKQLGCPALFHVLI